jgi:hypothetical protein
VIFTYVATVVANRPKPNELYGTVRAPLHFSVRSSQVALHRLRRTERNQNVVFSNHTDTFPSAERSWLLISGTTEDRAGYRLKGGRARRLGTPRDFDKRLQVIAQIAPPVVRRTLLSRYVPLSHPSLFVVQGRPLLRIRLHFEFLERNAPQSAQRLAWQAMPQYRLLCNEPIPC